MPVYRSEESPVTQLSFDLIHWVVDFTAYFPGSDALTVREVVLETEAGVDASVSLDGDATVDGLQVTQAITGLTPQLRYVFRVLVDGEDGNVLALETIIVCPK